MDARISLTRSTGKVLQERLQGAYTRGDYNPIEYLWRNTKKRATHAKYFEQFSQVITPVERTLEHCASPAEAVLALFGRYCHEAGLAVS